jgi:hypothetical protein
VVGKPTGSESDAFLHADYHRGIVLQNVIEDRQEVVARPARPFDGHG